MLLLKAFAIVVIAMAAWIIAPIFGAIASVTAITAVVYIVLKEDKDYKDSIKGNQ